MRLSTEKVRRRLPYQRRLFLMLLVFSWVLVACFVAFQYGREKLYKAEAMNSRLQMLNMRILDGIEKGDHSAASGGVPSWSPVLTLPSDSCLRISIIALDGTLIYDVIGNTGDHRNTPLQQEQSNGRLQGHAPTDNHLTRPEVSTAMAKGSGYTIRRQSDTTGETYFYSAMRGDSCIVRTAVPYTMTLTEVLDADSRFLWFMLGVTLLMCIIGYVATRKIGMTISRLNLFAKKAERGEQIALDEPFPHDELGDISHHIVRLYAQLQKATENLNREHERTLFEEQEKIRIKKQLTNNINHELKTPVASIAVCIETLIEHPELSADKRNDFLERARANSERLCALLNDVSTITRMDDGSLMIDKQLVDIRKVIDEVIDDSNIRLQEAGITVDVTGFPDDAETHSCGRPPEASVALNGNASLLSSVFRNLTDNAIAYANCRNIRIRLLENTDEMMRIAFADDGNGIEEKHLPHIFERFYRVDKGRSRKLGGTGLGLAIVNNAVSLHGGTITARNLPEGGLEFVFTLKKNA